MCNGEKGGNRYHNPRVGGSSPSSATIFLVTFQEVGEGTSTRAARLPAAAPEAGHTCAPMEIDGPECYVYGMVEQVDAIESDRLAETMERLGRDGTAGTAVAVAWAALLLWPGVPDLLGHPEIRRASCRARVG